MDRERLKREIVKMIEQIEDIDLLTKLYYYIKHLIL